MSKGLYNATEDPATLQASTEVSANGNGDAVLAPGGNYTALAFTLDVTALASVAGDKLDVFVQTKLDGTNWLDIVHFAQPSGNGSAARWHAKVRKATTQNEFEASASLAAAAQRHLMGPEYRVRWAITDGTGTHTFTFSVVMTPI